ncbi:MAG: tetratricopeptide repeat protein [Bacteriovoracaceae bacterium]|jgi:tetratricopeptide (TPR) repeat protein|nr:tetratricopeptide repeat protein [Bacteriovoracaceae bacterium]
MDNERELEIFNKAKNCFDRREYKKSLSLFSEVIEINSRNSEAFFFLANIFHIQGKIGKAIKAFTKVLELDPNNTDASISLSVLYNDIGKYERGQAVFESANEKVKKKAGAQVFSDPHVNKKFSHKHLELADLYSSYNRFDEAVFEYKKAIGLNPDDLEARIRIAKAYSKKGFTSKAIEELKKLKNEYPAFAPARISLGVIYYGQGNILEAQTQWQMVLAKDPKNDDAKMYLNLSKSATETNLTVFN